MKKNILEVIYLSGVATNPPAISGSLADGVMVTWSGDDGAIFLAASAENEFAPVMVNPTWATSQSPAIQYVSEWGIVFIAWVNDSQILLGSSEDDFNQSMVVGALTVPNSKYSAPSLTWGDGLLYIGWVDYPYFQCAWLNIYGDITPCNIPSYLPAEYSPVTINYFAGQFFVTMTYDVSTEMKAHAEAEAKAKAEGAELPKLSLTSGTTRILVSDRFPSKFTLAYNGIPTQTVGSATFTTMDEMMFLVWSSPSNTNLTVGVSFDLDQGFIDTTVLPYQVVGSPTMDQFWNSIVFTWIGAGNTIALGVAGPILNNTADVVIVPTPLGCTNEQVWNPVEERCVERDSCNGKCVISSYRNSPFGPIFNPVAWTLCMKENQCKD